VAKGYPDPVAWAVLANTAEDGSLLTAAHRIAGVHRIQLDNALFEGRNAVYLIGAQGTGPTTLVDTGLATRSVEAALRDGLADHGVGVADLDRILLTHYHADHAGLAGELQRESGATVHVHRADLPLVAREDGAWEALRDQHLEAFDTWGMPNDAQEELLAFLDAHDDIVGDPAAVEPFEDGTTFQAGSTTLTAIHLPGHTRGLCGFEGLIEGENALLSGDALLPRYTPNVGGADVRTENPLAKYVDSLARMVDTDYDRAYPGHRDPIDDPTARAETIRRHHRDRTSRAIEVLQEHGPADAWTVSAHLFGDLENIHILHGPGEAAAHLKHLVDHGVVERSDDAYSLIDRDVDIGNLFPTAPTRSAD
jgi:glyoxylase-like metal-dependent hydrolase (beta-lactamase superfamily II)